MNSLRYLFFYMLGLLTGICISVVAIGLWSHNSDAITTGVLIFVFVVFLQLIFVPLVFCI